MLADGADILDIGGYSSRPGATDISAQEETARVVPVIEAIHKNFPKAIISVDTFRASVAEASIAAMPLLLMIFRVALWMRLCLRLQPSFRYLIY
ncbi:hypothetical protein GCM10028895_31420 [Pontibacter rugosus]